MHRPRVVLIFCAVAHADCTCPRGALPCQVSACGKGLARVKNLDRTIAAFLQSATRIILRIILLVICLSLLGVSSSFFSTGLAALVFAIAFALQTLMSNFASGMMLLFFRYFKVGDWVNFAGVEGNVRSIRACPALRSAPLPCLL